MCLNIEITAAMPITPAQIVLNLRNFSQCLFLSFSTILFKEYSFVMDKMFIPLESAFSPIVAWPMLSTAMAFSCGAMK